MKKLFLLVFLSLCINACEDGDDEVDITLQGEWVLENVVCFCFFGDNFDFSQHKLIVDVSNSSVHVQNSDNTYFIAETGEYNLTMNNSVIWVDGNGYTYEIADDKLILTYVDEPNIADDERTLIYTKG